MKYAVAAFVLLASVCAFAQNPAVPPDQVSGMYTFLSDGEFVQIDVEDGTHITGFISRYGDSTSDKGAFLDHLIKEGDLKGNKVHFVTKTVHGVWYEFTGTAETDSSKDPSKEGFHLLKGKLTMTTEGDKAVAKSREVTFKSMPMDDAVRQ